MSGWWRRKTNSPARPTPFFPHKLAKGYGNPMGHVLAKVNGMKVRNLQHVVELLRDIKDDYVVFEFEGRGAETVVLPRRETIAASEDILSDNGVRSQGTPELMSIWKAGK